VQAPTVWITVKN